jgi:hypothetical protein
VPKENEVNAMTGKKFKVMILRKLIDILEHINRHFNRIRSIAIVNTQINVKRKIINYF